MDETAEANCIGTQLESLPLQRESHTQLSLEERHDLTPFTKDGVIHNSVMRFRANYYAANSTNALARNQTNCQYPRG